MPKVCQTRWNFKSRLVFTVLDYRTVLLDVFDEIIEGEDFESDNISIREAGGLKNLLLDYNFNLLLNIFKKIFTQTDLIFNIIQNQTTDMSYSKNRIIKLIETLKEYREKENHFEFIRSDILDRLDISEPPKKKGKNVTKMMYILINGYISKLLILLLCS